MTAAPAAEITFALHASKRAIKYESVGSKKPREAVILEDRMALLPDTPAGFSPRSGGYKEIAALATKLNQIQLDQDFLDYLYYADVDTASGSAD